MSPSDRQPPDRSLPEDPSDDLDMDWGLPVLPSDLDDDESEPEVGDRPGDDRDDFVEVFGAGGGSGPREVGDWSRGAWDGAAPVAGDPPAGDVAADGDPDAGPDAHGWYDWRSESAEPASSEDASEDASELIESELGPFELVASESDGPDAGGDVNQTLPDATSDDGGASLGPTDPDAERVDPGTVPPTRAVRRIWMGALVLLLVATGLAVVPAVGDLAPGVANGVGSAAGWVGDRVASGAGSASDRWSAWTTELRSQAASIPQQQVEEQRQLAGAESLLVVVTDGAGATVGLALVVRGMGVQPTITLIPPGLYEILPGYGDFPLRDATVFEGPELTRVAVVNLLGVRIDALVTLGPGDIAAIIGDSLPIDLAVPLVLTDPDGTETVVADQGFAIRSAEQAEIILATRGSDDQLGWLQRQAAVWEALFASAADGPFVPERIGALSGDPDDVTGIVAAVAAGDPQVTVLPVSRVAVRGADEGFKLASAESERFIARNMAHLELWPGSRPRTEILNGNGGVLTTRRVAESLVNRGFRIVNTDNAENFDFDVTLVVAQGRQHRDIAAQVIELLGTGELLLELRAPSGVVDISIIVGHDIPAAEG